MCWAQVPSGLGLLDPPLWGGGDLAGALWVGDPASALLWHYLTSVAAPACLVLLALSAVGSNAALPRTLPSISYDSSPLLRQFSSPKTVQPQQHRQPQAADLLCARHMLGPECRRHSNWDVFS